VIDSLCNQAKKENIAVAVFYSDFISQQEQSITNIVGAILRQLVAKRRNPGLSTVREGFKKHKRRLAIEGYDFRNLWEC